MTAAVVDRDLQLAISEVLNRYSTGIDSRDWELFRTCFTEDCEADYGDVGFWRSADEITAWMEQAHAACGYTLHRITNQVITVTDTGAKARSYVDAIVMGGDNASGVQATGFYDDELVLTDDGWKIARRRNTIALLRPVQSMSATQAESAL